MLQSVQPSSHFDGSSGGGVQLGGLSWTKLELASAKTRSEMAPGRYTPPDSVGAAKVFRLDGCQRGANFLDDFCPAKRPGGAGFVQMRLHKLRVEREGALGELERLVMPAQPADHARQVRPADFVLRINFQRLLHALDGFLRFVPRFKQNSREIVPGLEIRWIQLERPAIGGFRFDEPARRRERDALIKLRPGLRRIFRVPFLGKSQHLGPQPFFTQFAGLPTSLFRVQFQFHPNNLVSLSDDVPFDDKKMNFATPRRRKNAVAPASRGSFRASRQKSSAVSRRATDGN